jgi:hypothetical protein
MIRIIVLCIAGLLFSNIGAQKASSSSKSKPGTDKNAPVIDQKKMAKANALIAQGMKEKDKGKQSELLNNAIGIYTEMKMAKEGNIAVGDEYYKIGDLKTATRYYAKGGKDSKVDLSKKVGDAYLEEAFKETDPKLQKKAFDNAYKNLAKAFGPLEANRMIGNQFFDMGSEQYPKALEYYGKANYMEGIYMIGDLYAGKSETMSLAAETYSSTKTKEGFKKAGDLYFGKGDYPKAMEFYVQGGVTEGYIKYATELKKAGKLDMYNTVIEIVTDTMKMQNKMDDIKEYAIVAERESNFVLAQSLYNKLGEKDLEQKYKAYGMMMRLEAIPAKTIFQQMGKEDMVADIDKNIKQLTTLQQSFLTLNELQKSVPKVSTKVNQNTGQLEYDKNDLKLRDQFYGNPATQKAISDVVYQIGKEFNAFKGNEELKGLVRQAFLKYAPVKNILDTYMFTKKIIPINITPAAVTF